MFARACGRYSAPKNSFRNDHRSQPTHGIHAADLILARALGHDYVLWNRGASRDGLPTRSQPDLQSPL